MKENTCYDKLINGVNENGTIVFYGKKNPMRAFFKGRGFIRSRA